MVQTRSAYVTPNTPRKRARTTRDASTQTTVIYQGSRPEMKTYSRAIVHTAATLTELRFNQISQGTGPGQRIGSKIKVLRLEGMIRCPLTSVRLTIYAPKDVNEVMGASLEGPIDRDKFWVIKDWWLHSNTSADNRGHFFHHKFPLGANSEYVGTNGSGLRKNSFLLRIQTTGSTDATGYMRCWYIDP